MVQHHLPSDQQGGGWMGAGGLAGGAAGPSADGEGAWQGGGSAAPPTVPPGMHVQYAQPMYPGQQAPVQYQQLPGGGYMVVPPNAQVLVHQGGMPGQVMVAPQGYPQQYGQMAAVPAMAPGQAGSFYASMRPPQAQGPMHGGQAAWGMGAEGGAGGYRGGPSGNSGQGGRGGGGYGRRTGGGGYGRQGGQGNRYDALRDPRSRR